jgi:hypothetical protein
MIHTLDDNLRAKARERLAEVLRRHVEAVDYLLSDDDLVWAVIGRYERGRGLALIDPSE